MSEPSLLQCTNYGNVSINHGPTGIHRRRVYKCWTCERRTPHVIKWDGAYYGTTQYCIVCLDGWQDGERMERPFRRGWKKDRAAYIRRLWDTAMLPARYKAWTEYDLHTIFCDVQGDCAECNARPS